ncbi:LysR family transcriptional regulator [Limibacillus halophilus]|uniref:DNA-binding transcriptional LysR family regulator n=1 Tax=Limibacillus halophilus TaxID=1579333 RepID=A0A839SRQ4_9PROT|nr:LysR family transcriptional regulator [Limibacillus halophilus]MBB3064474.1 DNA-binding transcriptional LysR family regulator [Limibacillus halophilus]
MQRFTIKQCAYFCAVAEQGGIAAAARVLGVSQPAVAQGIDKLEEMAGLVLFHRFHARGMALTRQGAEFHSYATDILASARKMENAAAEIAQNRRGSIRLGCFQSIAPFCVARIVREYRTLAPKVTLDITEKLQGELNDAILTDDLDLAIMYDLGLNPSLLSWQTLSLSPLYLIVPAGHRLAGSRPVSIREVANEDYILFDAPGSRDYFFSIFARYGIGPRIAFRSTSIESVRTAVGNGLGVSILSMRPVPNVTYDGGRVVPVDLEETLPPIPIVIAQRADRTVNPLEATFMDHCRQVFSGIQPGSLVR